ncbi:hypothetical protein DM02DRAFT_629041 [Periconia macrospinosa]|uniref:Uncharacterized protein n=1 Tax=Periconia macrospinosa TaxID=97972 RepID=A0A2V1DPD0_9PLEO|nr:hypothetical protein DM02DRAFT_629041 [Periconia macrospinosa]
MPICISQFAPRYRRHVTGTYQQLADSLPRQAKSVANFDERDVAVLQHSKFSNSHVPDHDHVGVDDNEGTEVGDLHNPSSSRQRSHQVIKAGKRFLAVAYGGFGTGSQYTLSSMAFGEFTNLTLATDESPSSHRRFHQLPIRHRTIKPIHYFMQEISSHSRMQETFEASE